MVAFLPEGMLSRNVSAVKLSDVEDSAEWWGDLQ